MYSTEVVCSWYSHCSIGKRVYTPIRWYHTSSSARMMWILVELSCCRMKRHPLIRYMRWHATGMLRKASKMRPPSRPRIRQVMMTRVRRSRRRRRWHVRSIPKRGRRWWRRCSSTRIIRMVLLTYTHHMAAPHHTPSSITMGYPSSSSTGIHMTSRITSPSRWSPYEAATLRVSLSHLGCSDGRPWCRSLGRRSRQNTMPTSAQRHWRSIWKSRSMRSTHFPRSRAGIILSHSPREL
jgi:hypothetical protein